jgi:hypothetical protein
MLCPHCQESIKDGATKCPLCTGSIIYRSGLDRATTGMGSSQANDLKWQVSKWCALIGAIGGPIAYLYFFDDITFQGFLWSVGIGTVLGFGLPNAASAQKG